MFNTILAMSEVFNRVNSIILCIRDYYFIFLNLLVYRVGSNFKINKSEDLLHFDNIITKLLKLIINSYCDGIIPIKSDF